MKSNNNNNNKQPSLSISELVKKGNLQEIQSAYLEQNSKFDIIDTALRLNRTDFVKWLITAKGNVNSNNINFLLIESISLAIRTGDIEIVERLLKVPKFSANFVQTQKHKILEKESDEDYHVSSNCTDNVSLCNRLGLLKLLSKYNIDLGLPSKYNQETALHVVSASGELAAVRFLLESGVNPNSKTITGVTALHLACMNDDNEEMVQLLLHYGASMMTVDNTGRNALIFAVKTNAVKIARLLLKSGCSVDYLWKRKKTPIFCACENKNEDMVRLLIDYKANLMVCDHNNNTLLHCIASTSSKYPYDEKQYRIGKLLLERNIGIDDVNCKGSTALHLAVQNKHLKLIKLLFNNNADINAKDNHGNTPFHRFVQTCTHRGYWYKEIFDLFIFNDIYLDEVNNDRETVLHNACFSGNAEIVKSLLDYGSNTECITEIVHYHAGTIFKNKEVLTILLNHCVAKGYDKLVKSFLDSCLSVNDLCQENSLVLHSALEYFYNNMVFDGSVPNVSDVVYMLLLSGANPNIKNKNNESPLLFSINTRLITFEFSILRYLILLNFKGKYVNEDDLDLINRKYPSIYVKTCIDELSAMKKDVIWEKITVFSILSDTVHSIAECLLDANIINNFNLDKIEKKYPVYFKFVKTKYSLAVERNIILYSAKEAFHYLINQSISQSSFPTCVEQKIFQYLSLNDLKCLNEIHFPNNYVMDCIEWD